MNTIRAQRPHVFVEDPDLRDDRTKTAWCMCGRPQGNKIHDLPKVSDEQRAHEARRTGERNR